MSKITFATTDTADLGANPVLASWVLSGAPETRSRLLARSRDRTSYTMVWDCTGGRFNWRYHTDETVVVLEGEAFVTDENGEEHRIGPGDVTFFPAGASAVWRVPKYVRKAAFLRIALPPPLGFVVRAWNFLVRTITRRTGGL